jgi:hypothetical protein
VERPDPARRPRGHYPAPLDASEVTNLQARSRSSLWRRSTTRRG